MSRKSGWCSQLGIPDHAGCRIPESCDCGCPEDAAKRAQRRAVEGEFAALAWDTCEAASTANEAARTTAAKRSRPGLTPTSRTTGTEG